MTPEHDPHAEAPPDADAADPDRPENWSDDRRREYRLALDARRERQVRAGRGFAVAVMLLVAAGVVFRLPESWWVPAVGAAAALGVVFRLANWKCPDCGERLSSRRPGGRCPGCGAPLD